jgi:hypothetical protein
MGRLRSLRQSQAPNFGLHTIDVQRISFRLYYIMLISNSLLGIRLFGVYPDKENPWPDIPTLYYEWHKCQRLFFRLDMAAQLYPLTIRCIEPPNSRLKKFFYFPNKRIDFPG